MNRIELETDDGRLGEVVDEVLSKMARGESVDIERYAAENPDFADVLRHAIPALHAVAQSGSGTIGTRVHSGWPFNAEMGTPTAGHRSLGDYQIIRELGRGGMGVVYEAEQATLGRKVALKVLPFAGMIRGNALQRFHNEVRAAATLDHPNIVSVYSVGEERGVHYYAMQLIRGQSLAEVIGQLVVLQNGGRSLTAESISDVLSAVKSNGIEDLQQSLSFSELRSRPRWNPPQERVKPKSGLPASSSATAPTEELPSRIQGQGLQSTRDERKGTAATFRSSVHDRDFYRSIAVLAVQAADALEHAHERGVIHRDIKPGNLMLDAKSQLYVTDFGLARIESDAAMTMTGDLVGTLRYMSPEQALANRVVIDHRSDLYSLGMTLYELLTMRPAFTTSDRQELLQQIASEDPTWPRQLNRCIPAELETIVLKSIEKRPEDRYPSAAAMAEEFRAFLEDRPIQAKRPTLIQRTVKWSRRHRTLVNTAVATLAAAIAVSGMMLWQERSKTFAALVQATTQQQLAQAQTKRARRSQAVANRQRNNARWNQYCAEVVSGQIDQQQGQIKRLERKLLRHLPTAGQEDFRGWEWYYLFSLCHPEIRTLEGAGYTAAWSPDGAYIASGGLIYDAETGECVRRLVPSRIKRTRGEWSPDSKMYAWGTTDDDNCIYIWNRDSDGLAELRGLKDSVWCLDWSPDGKLLASGGMDKEVWIWDVATRAPIRKLAAREYITGLSWSPDGELLAAGVKRNRLMVWNPSTGEPLMERDGLGEDGEGYSLQPVWHPSSDRLAVSNHEFWLILQRSDWSVIYQQDRKQRQAPGFSVAWRPDGKRIAYANDGSATILDPSDEKVPPVTYENIGASRHIAWSPDAEKLVTLEMRRYPRMKIWKASSHQPPVISADGSPQSLSWLPDSETLVTVDATDCSISSWRISDGVRLTAEPVPVKSAPLAGRAIWSPDRRFAAVPLKATPARIQVLDRTAGSIHSIWVGSDETDRVRGVSWSHDGMRLAIRMNRGRKTKVEFWRVDDEESLSVWTLNGRASNRDTSMEMAWSPDGSRVAVAAMGEDSDNGTPGQQGHVYVVDVSRGETLLKHNLAGWQDESRVTALAWSPDGRTIVAGNHKGLIEAVDVESGQVRFSNRVSSTVIRALDYSPGGRRIVSAAEDGTVKVYGGIAGEDLVQFQLDGKAHHACWSPNGKRLAAATGEGAIHVWDATRAFEFSAGGGKRGEFALAYARSLQRLGSLEKRARLQGVVRLAPDTLGYWEIRGNAHAKLGDFEKASQEFSKAIEPGLDRSNRAAMDLGYALLGAGKTKAFREYCKSLLMAIAEVESPATGGQLAWLCALEENDLLDTKTMVRLGRADAIRNKNGDRARCVLGAALYRDQQYQLAVDTLSDVADRLEAKSDPNEAAQLASTLYFLAMARQRLGHGHQAARILADADTKLSDVETIGDWRDVVQTRVLREQATEIVVRSSQ